MRLARAAGFYPKGCPHLINGPLEQREQSLRNPDDVRASLARDLPS